MYNARSRRRRRHIVPEEREKTFRSHLDSIKISTLENKSATDLPKVSILSHTHRPLILWGRSWGTRWHRCCWAWRWYWWGWPSRMWTDDLPLGLDGGQQRKHHVTSQFFLQWHKGLIFLKTVTHTGCRGSTVSRIRPAFSGSQAVLPTTQGQRVECWCTTQIPSVCSHLRAGRCTMCSKQPNKSKNKSLSEIQSDFRCWRYKRPPLQRLWKHWI